MTGPPWRVVPRHTRFSPVFVLGHVRSGTSLMCRLLLDHLGVNFGTESQFIVRYYQKLQRYGDLGDDANLRRLLDDVSQERFFSRTRQNFGFVLDVERAARAVGPERTYSNVLRAIFGQFAETQGQPRWGDKTPRYALHLPVIYGLFPDAQFIHVARDGRDVTLSLVKMSFGPQTAYESALEWRETVTMIRSFGRTLSPDVFTEVRYEDLLDDPTRVMRHVAEHLGIDNAGDVAAAIAPRLRTQVRENNACLWPQDMTPREITCFESIAGRELEAFGYPLRYPSAQAPGPFSVLAWRAQGLFRRLRKPSYWTNNWYHVGLRVRDAVRMLRRRAL
jgi:hypothetical protein